MEGSPALRDTIVKRLESARRELLDLTTRNRLLDTPRHRTRAKTVEVVDEKGDEIFRLLFLEGRKLAFLPRASEAPDIDDTGDLGDVDDPSVFALDQTPGTGEDPAPRHLDSRLQTAMEPQQLEKRLLQLHYDARSALDEQGFNILFLAIGFLRWFEDGQPDRPRHAPLLLIPVTLERSSARSGFRLRYSEDDLNTNLSLQEKLKTQFSIAIPDLPAEEDLTPKGYFDAVAKKIRGRPGWAVLADDMVLGIFSFSKFLMYQDLDPKNWPKRSPLQDHALVDGLLESGFPESEMYDDNLHVDSVTDPGKLPHVLDADASQTLAIEEVRRGRHLIIQGPPGTGKSQTITNLIAAAVHDNKSVLFVAEKRAALEVVKKRLDEVGLGDMCLELHSHKARKGVVLEDLGRTLNLGRPAEAHRSIGRQLRTSRDRLNRYADLLHTPRIPSGVTPYMAFAELTCLRRGGITPPDFEVEGQAQWTPEVLAAHRRLVGDHARLLADIGVPQQHLWRGVGATALLPSDAQRLLMRAEELRACLAQVTELADKLNEAVKLDWRSIDDTEALCAVGRLLSAAPPEVDRDAIDDDAWATQLSALRDVVSKGRAHEVGTDQVSAVLGDQVWVHDLSGIRTVLARHGSSYLRFLSSEYRQAIRELRSFATGELPRTPRGRVALLDALARAKAARATIEAGDAISRGAFGRLWRATDSNWESLQQVVEWVERCAASNWGILARNALKSGADPVAAGEQGLVLEEQAGRLREQLSALFGSLKLDLVEAFGNQSLGGLPLHLIADRLEQWQAAPGRLNEWLAFRERDAQLRSEGLAALADRLRDGRVTSDEAEDVLRFSFYEAVVREVWAAEPDLRNFDGRQHGRLVEEFQDLDRTRMKLARAEVAATHFAGIPRGGGAGQMGVIRREIEKKRRHLPLRKLMNEAGAAIQKIKPVFMMSPMSIAQYVSPGALEFDLLLIDEASQVQPVEALGAVARTRQMVVVGDKRQLPPTRFFDALMSEDEQDDDFQAADMESILALCEAQGVPGKMLRWHYRSKHASLIAVSNNAFYDDRLFIVPSADSSDGMGLQFHVVEDAVYDRGGSAVNSREAAAVADAVIDHAKMHPSKSLGVGTFSVRQRDEILDQLELRRRQRPELEVFFGESGLEPFFVKNLETIQGDERDVIFISIGYGKDSSGYMAMNFGPLSSDGGERRLNVLISRARERMEVFSSITADDIDLARTNMIGPRVLKRFLRYAASGYMDTPEVGERGPDSPFEEDVARALAGIGHRVVHQVGTAGFFVDLAVVDPDQPGRYVLGIECDGASYHSSRSARDRDRLRQAVLESRGWRIHRVWSTDWFKDPEGELRKLHQVLLECYEQVANEPDSAGTPVTPEDGPERAVEREVIEREEVDPPPLLGASSTAYVEAQFNVPTEFAPHELSVEEMVKVVQRIVELEGPVHGEEVARRVASLWGLQRAGRRIREAADAALRRAAAMELVAASKSFYSIDGREPVARSRANVASTTLRKAEMLPPSEIEEALRLFVAANVGCAADEAVVGATRILGFQRAGQDLSSVIKRGLRRMLAAEALVLRSGTIYLGGS